MKRNLSRCFAIAFVTTVCTAMAFGGTVVNPIGQTDISGLMQGSGTGMTARGWDFMVNSDGLAVTELGVGTTQAGVMLTLSLWDQATQTMLASTTVTTGDSTWVFGSLATPEALTKDRTYTVLGWADRATCWYMMSNSSAAPWEPTGPIQYLRARYGNGIAADAFPADTLNGGQWGIVDIGYTASSAAETPEPSAFLLGGAGLGVVGLLRRRLV